MMNDGCYPGLAIFEFMEHCVISRPNVASNAKYTKYSSTLYTVPSTAHIFVNAISNIATIQRNKSYKDIYDCCALVNSQKSSNTT